MFNMSFEILPTTFRKRKSQQTHDRCVCTQNQNWSSTKKYILTAPTESERDRGRQQNKSLAELRSCQLLPFSLMNIETTSYFLFWCALQHEIRTTDGISISCKLADSNDHRLTVSYVLKTYSRDTSIHLKWSIERTKPPTPRSVFLLFGTCDFN